jgi:hypothetical protein
VGFPCTKRIDEERNGIQKQELKADERPRNGEKMAREGE